MSKPKIEEIQYLRGFAFLAVVLQHAIGHYFAVPEAKLEDGVLMGLLLLLAKFAVPLFIFITGLVLFYNYDSGVRFAPFVRKRCKDILLPYLPWALLYALLAHRPAASWESIRRLGLDVLTGTASYHLWYVVMIFQFYLLFPSVQRAVLPADRSVRGKAGIAALVLLGMFYIGYMGVRGTFSAAVGRLPIPVLSDLFTTYDDRNALHYFYYFLLGAAAGLHPERWKAFLNACRVYIRIGYGLLFGVMLYATISGFRLSPQLAIQYNATLLLQPLMAAFLIVAVIAMHTEALAFARSAPNRLRTAVNQIGSLSYVAYLAHALVLSGAIWSADLLMPGRSVTLRVLAAFAFCSAGSVGLAYLLRKGKLYFCR